MGFLVLVNWLGSIPLQSMHLIWTRLSCLEISTSDTLAQLSMQQEVDIIMNRFIEIDITGKVNIKAKLCEIAYLDKTSLCPPSQKVKTKGHVTKYAKATKRLVPSLWIVALATIFPTSNPISYNG